VGKHRLFYRTITKFLIACIIILPIVSIVPSKAQGVDCNLPTLYDLSETCISNHLPQGYNEINNTFPRAFNVVATASGDGIDLTWDTLIEVYLDNYTYKMKNITNFYFASRTQTGGFNIVGGNWNTNKVNANENDVAKGFTIISGDPKKAGLQKFSYKKHFPSSQAPASQNNILFIIIPANNPGPLRPERISRPSLAPYNLADNITIRVNIDLMPKDDPHASVSVSSFFGAPNDQSCRQNQANLTQSVAKIRDGLLEVSQILNGIVPVITGIAWAAPEQKNYLKEGLKALVYDPVVAWLNNNPDKKAAVQPVLDQLVSKSDAVYNELVSFRTNLATALESAQTVTPRLTAEDIAKKLEDAPSMGGTGGIEDIVKNQLGINNDCLLQFAKIYYRLSIQFDFNAAAIAANQGRTRGGAGGDTCGLGFFGDILCKAMELLAEATVGVGVFAFNLLLKAVGIQ